jgi:hypothetical protein
MGKKPAPKGKAKAKVEAKAPEPEVEEESAERLEAKRLWQQRRDASKWAKVQLEVIRGHQEAAKAKGNCDWLQVANDFHEIRLLRTCKRLEDKTLDAIPENLRQRMEAYLAQCSGGPNVEESKFNKDQDLWDLLPVEEGIDAYQRIPATPEAEAAAEKAKAWADASAQGIAGLVSLMQDLAAFPLVQEAGLVRIGGLFGEAREDGAPPMLGLTADKLMPVIGEGMKKHIADPEVQRSGCAALRGIAMADKQLPGLCDAGGVQLAVEAARIHFKVKDVVSAANGTFWAMAKASGRNSPEIAVMREAGVVEVLMKCMDHHAWDQTLVGRIRVTLPFITED